jgi:hypothetical protein
MATDNEITGSVEDADGEVVPAAEPDFVQAWLDAIESASDEEKDWRRDADKAVQAYRGKEGPGKSFNIYHANIETLAPAVYNSVPAPDVRRRFLDPNPAAKVVADIIERAISYSLDSYDFDGGMSAAVRDMLIPGRGQLRVRYGASVGEDDALAYEEVTCEYVPWRSFRRGPGRVWADVTWIAFEHFLDRTTIKARVPDAVFKEIPFKYSASAKTGEEEDNEEATKAPPRFGRRAHVWEIWDKEKREVHFICADYAERRLWTVEDPLELTDFYPIPRSLQAISTTDSLVPITSYSLYEALLKEFDDVNKRITKLIGALRPRAIYAGIVADIQAAIEADDLEFIPAQGAEIFIQSGGGLDKAISWFPLDPITSALQQLVQQRELIKQNIYEVTKIADVMRGVSDPRETKGAQQLKSEWGSLAVQGMQAEVARFARDLFRLKTEVIAGKMGFDTLLMMTGINLPTEQEKQAAIQQYQQAQAAAQQPQPQAEGQPTAEAPPAPPQPSPEEIKYYTGPSREEAEQLLRNDAIRSYHIDIESDSTVRADLGRQQQQMSEFLAGVGQFGQAVGPMIEAGAMPMEVAIEIFSSFARRFKLGKQAEDALDQWADQTKQQGQANQGQPDPAQAQAQAEQQAQMQAEQAKLQAEGEIEQARIAADQQKTQAQLQAEQAKAQAELQARMQEGQAKLAFEAERFKAETELRQQEIAIKRDEQAQKAIDAERANAIKERELALKEREIVMRSIDQDKQRAANTQDKRFAATSKSTPSQRPAA